MPCDSRVVETNMTDHEQLRSAMEALGWKIGAGSDELQVYGEKNGMGVGFSRRKAGDPFIAIDTNARLAIQKKYSEIGVRKWASKKGFAVTSFDGQKMKLVNRRG